jgi:hypothetical protein
MNKTKKNKKKTKQKQKKQNKTVKHSNQVIKSSSYSPTINQNLVTLKSISRSPVYDCNNEKAFILKEPLKKNDNKPLLIDDLTDKNIETKYMGFSKYLDNPPRRMDIRFIPYESWWSALLYFTGSAELNKKMRQIAKTKNLKLSEYGLFKENGKALKITSERDVFDILEIEYLHPRLR